MITFCLVVGFALAGDDVKAAAQPAPDGAQLFADKCAQCHKIGVLGNDFGPNLSDAGLRLTRDQIRESIVDPSKTIAKGYEFTELTLMDGSKPCGILAPQSAGQYLVKLPGGIVYRFDKAAVRKVTAVPVSGMTLFTDKLTPAQIDAATDYVFAQRVPVLHAEPREIPLAPQTETPSWILWLAGASALLLGFFVWRGAKKQRSI